MSLARGAAILCSNPRVWQYINALYNEELCKHPDHVRDFMYGEFGIRSRRELDTNVEASKKYLEFVENFNDWLNPGRHGNQKREPYKNPALLSLANGASCVRCDQCDGTVVACHVQGKIATLLGKGWSVKPDDYAVAELCASCHRLMDSYHSGNNPQYAFEWLKLILLTHARWFRMGYVGALPVETKGVVRDVSESFYESQAG